MEKMKSLPFGVIFLIGILFIVIILCIPIIIEYYFSMNTYCFVESKPFEKVEMWVGYSAAIVSSLTAFGILLIQYRQNRKENFLNRKLQLSILNFKKHDDFKENLKSALFDTYVNLDPIITTNLIDDVMEYFNNTDNENINRHNMQDKILNIKSNLDRSVFYIDILYTEKSNDLSNIQKTYLKVLIQVFDEFNCLLIDMWWLVKTFSNESNIKDDEATINETKEKVETYINGVSKVLNTKKMNIGEILIKYDYKFYSEYLQILQERNHNFIQSRDIKDIHRIILELIKMENESMKIDF